jgi:hypothetical protein
MLTGGRLRAASAFGAALLLALADAFREVPALDLAVVFLVAFFAVAFFAAGFFAAGFFAVDFFVVERFDAAVAFFAAGFFAREEVDFPDAGLRDDAELLPLLRSSAMTREEPYLPRGRSRHPQPFRMRPVQGLSRRICSGVSVRCRLAAIPVLAILVAPTPGSGGSVEGLRWAERIAAAERFADSRSGRISFALVDESGRLRGRHVDRVHHSASVVKVMFLVAYLRQPGVRDDELTRAERNLLGPMIKRSDNQSANEVYLRLGEGKLYELAREAGMKRFTTQPTWGLSTITAGEQARFFYRLERYVPRRHRRYAFRLLARIVPSQRWGIPPVAPRSWRLHFKGGWSGRPIWRVNQVMLLRRPPRRFSVAILTREQPSKDYGEATIEGVARRLLRGYP